MDILIVGGGAAGMMASIWCAKAGHRVRLFEKNEKLGKKLFITGKGRCNVTNDCEPEELLNHVVSNHRFLYSAFYTWNSQDVMKFFEDAGVPLKTERGNRVFPQSDHSSDIIRALEKEMKSSGVKVHLRTGVEKLLTKEEKIQGIVLEDGTAIYGDAVLLACGGLSYPTTGSTGDGYELARELGHTIVTPAPSLVPLVTGEDYIPKLQGLSLKNVTLTIRNGKKIVYEDFGEMMFTHFGVTGPLVLSASAYVGKMLEKAPLQAFIDLKPALTEEQLDARILREFDQAPNKEFKNVIGVLFPNSLTPIIIELSSIPADKKIHDITKEERAEFVSLVKAFPFTITGMGKFTEAIITRGGIKVREVNPGTMESKLIQNLYFAGEILDLDAVTGGFNLQIAWSTAYLAAKAICEKEEK